jgi:hypothetical protein
MNQTVKIDVIQTSTEGDGPISALVVFPKAEFVLGPPVLGHIKSLALLRLLDGTVWMLVLQGQVWSDARLHAAAGILARVSEQAFTKRSIERLLRKELGVDSVSLESPPIDGVDIRQWDIEKVAFALARRPAPGTSAAGRPESTERDARIALCEGLNEAVGRFFDSMDTEALRLATRGRRFDPRIYNYLAHRDYRQYRLQFARTFPGLLLTAVVAETRSLGEEMRSIIDSGAPLIKSLAARWKVRPGVIRHLVGRASSDMGIQWARDAKGLALALNALHPQDLPGQSPAEWSEFNRIVATGQRLFLRPVWESSAGLEWLRECIRRAKRKDGRALELWLPNWDELGRIDYLRAALSDNLRRSAGDGDTSITDAIDRTVLKIAHRGLNNVASQFSDELKRTQSRGVTTREILWREVLLPLVPEDFISADGRTRVTPLTTNRELRAHGTRMRNCLRHRSVRTVAGCGAIGTVFIVGIYDMHSGKALSTAEIKLISNRETGEYQLTTKQHTAFANRRPSQRCVRTLREFLVHCQTDGVREHLKNSWKKIGSSRRENGARPVNVPAALRCTLGEQFYDELVGGTD